jgi:hypothetical protein
VESGCGWRTLMTFRGLVQLRLVVRRCRNAECALYHLPYRAEEEGAWALPHGEFGLDIITVIGQLRYGEHRSIPEIHQRLVQRGVSIAPRTAVLQKVSEEHEGHEAFFLFSLCDPAKQVDDEGNLTDDVPLFYTMHLPFPNHIHDLISLQSSPRRLERKETQPGFDASLDEAMILFDDVVEIFDLPQFTAFRNISLSLEFGERLWIGCVFIDGDHSGINGMGGTERL